MLQMQSQHIYAIAEKSPQQQPQGNLVEDAHILMKMNEGITLWETLMNPVTQLKTNGNQEQFRT